MRCLFLGALIPAVVLAWQQPAFEVADVKPSDPAVVKMGKGRMLPGGRIEVPGYTVKDLIMFTYSVTDNMIFGGPKWADDDRFDIVAKAPTDAPMDSLRMMMKTLLADRFKLAIHNEDRPMPVWVLTVAKNPPSLQPGSGDGRSQCHWTEFEGSTRRRECQNLTMSDFAKELPATGGIGIDLPVVDQTGLTGSYDFQFDVGTVSNRSDVPASADAPVILSSGPTIFAALLKIGLRLESRRMPLPVIVVDRVERPGQN